MEDCSVLVLNYLEQFKLSRLVKLQTVCILNREPKWDHKTVWIHAQVDQRKD